MKGRVPAAHSAVFALFVLSFFTHMGKVSPHSSSQNRKKIYCRVCGAEITEDGLHVHVESKASSNLLLKKHQRDGREVHQFRNPQGQIFDVATFTSAKNVAKQGQHSVANSFYPPYGWRMVTCSRCSAHLGWHMSLHDTGAGTDSAPLHQCKNRQDLKSSLRVLEKRLVRALRKTCLVWKKTPGDYWSFQWCHGKKLVQFHQVQQSEQNPVYSLGKFQVARFELEIGNTRVKKLNAKNFDPSKLILVEEFSDGQICHETNTGRQGRVRLRCCPDEEDMRIMSIEEVGKCVYVVDVCVPEMCSHGVCGASSEQPDLGETHSAAVEQVEESKSREKPSHLESFYALRWDALLLDDTQETSWIVSLRPTMSLVA